MRAGRLNLSLLLLAVGLASGGCEQLQPFRQGVLSTYREELRDLAVEVNRKELAKDANREERAEEVAETATTNVTQAAQWEPAPLISAIRLRPPVAYGAAGGR